MYENDDSSKLGSLNQDRCGKEEENPHPKLYTSPANINVIKS